MANEGHSSDRPAGLTTFTLEGRAAPALFLVGWLATLLGLGATVIGFLAGGGLPGGILFLAGLGVLSVGLIAAAGSQAIERRAGGQRAYAGPSPVLVFLAVVAVTLFLVVLVGTPLVHLGLDPRGPFAALVSIIASAIAYIVLVALVVVGTGALSWRELGIVRPSRAALSDVAWGAVLAVPVLFVTGLVGLALSQFLPVPEGPLPPMPDAPALAMNLVTAAIVAPIGEELFFRGFATTAWARLRGERQAIVRGAIFFAIAHIVTLGGETVGEGLGFAAFAFAVRLPVAIALGWMFLRRRTLYGPIALHAVFNGLQVLAAGGAGGALNQ